MPPIDWHLVRLGSHAERDYVTKARPLYDGIVVNANLVQATVQATSVSIVNWRKPYLVDPVNYAFALDPALLRSKASKSNPKPGMKSTFAALAGKYRLPISLTDLQERPLAPDDFTAPASVDLFANAVVGFQTNWLRDALQSTADFALGEAEAPQPARLIAPYFVVGDSQDPWLEINLAAMRSLSDRTVTACLAYDSRSVGTSHTAALAASYESVSSDEIMVWATDLDEHRSSLDALIAYSDLVQRLGSSGRRVVAAYGGFFAIMLAFRGMRGLAHGPGYGDKRNLEPVTGGGVPPAMFYLRPLRDSIPVGSLPAVIGTLSEAEYREQVCGCPICSGLLKHGVSGLVAQLTETELRATPVRGPIEVSTPFVYRACRFHFMFNRAAEVEHVNSLTLFGELESELHDNRDWIAARLGRGAARHLDLWLTAANPVRR